MFPRDPLSGEINVLVPCKALGAGKSRLAAVLDPSHRRNLCSAFLSSTLSRLRIFAPTGRIAVITSDQDAEAIVRKFDATIIPDPGLGLNEAVGKGRAELARYVSAPLLVVPIDLPMVRATDYKRATARSSDVVVAADRTGTGTNLLYLGTRSVSGMPFLFGPGSLNRHVRAAESRGYTVEVVRSPRLNFDIDTPTDLTEWCESNDMSNPADGWRRNLTNAPDFISVWSDNFRPT